MIFAARDVLVSLAFFSMVYAPLSGLALLAWWAIRRSGTDCLPNSASFLFWLRVLPFAVSVVVTVFLTVPSFWMMERTSPDEDTATFLLALCSLVILGAGILRVTQAQARTTRALAHWVQGAGSFDHDAGWSQLRASSGAPPIILAGIRKPRVMVSDTAVQLLSDSELQAAIRHELGHRRSWDNLKKFLISAIPFPGVGGLDRAWREAAEFAADDGAVTKRQEALDLAAALIRLSRLPSAMPERWLATGLVSGSASIGRRVERLLNWNPVAPHDRLRRILTRVVLLMVMACILANYGAALALTHRLTELLVP